MVAPPAGGVADHLRDDVNGIAIPPRGIDEMATSIVALTLDVTRRRRLSEGARRTALALDWSEELDRLDACYRGMIGRRWRNGRAHVERRAYIPRVGGAARGAIS